jgi:necrosis inducing protein (NPP1)
MSKRLCLLVSAGFLVVLAVLTSAGSAKDATPDPRLLALYEPVLQFDPLERFVPTKVQSFITDAVLEELSGPGTWTPAQLNAPPGDLPGPGTGTWRLNEDACTPAAPVGGLACYGDAAGDGGGGPAVYGRVTHENGQIVLQYWYFYYDDVYSYAYPPSDFIWQAHEGDWESVTVVLSDDEQPQLVGYSQHCSGQTRAWDDTPRLDDTHPLVHVALGSHANYFDSGTHPIDLTCLPAQAQAALNALLNALHLPPPVDYAFEGPTAGPPGSGSVMPIHEIGDQGPGWVQFPGFWGELQYLHAPAPIGTVALGTSPVGPAFHAEWTDPLGTLASWHAG